MLFLNGILILLAILAFSLAYAHRYKKGEWLFIGIKKEHIRDISQYHKQQSLLNLLLGIVFLLVPLSIYAVEMWSISPQWLYSWYVIVPLFLFWNIVELKRNKK